MTASEALKIIDKVHDYPCPYGIGGKAWRFIRICIEKQMPKKPDYEEYDAKCPVCGHEFENNVKEAVAVDDIDNLVKEFAKDINVLANPEQLKGEENG